MITQTHRLDVVPGGITTVVHVKQYQTDESLVFELFSRFGDFEISANFTECTVRGTKSDGNGYSANATCDPSNNSVTVQLTEQMTAVAGRQPYEITVTDSTGRMITTTFILDVHRAALDADTVESESVIKEVQTIVEEYIEENPGLFVVDPTLTQSGEAADAKVTGDEIADLKSALKYPFNTSLADGYWSADGTASYQSSGGKEKRTTIMPVANLGALRISVNLSTSHNNWCSCLFWDSENVAISRPAYTPTNTSNYTCSFAIPTNAEYASISFRTFDDGNLTYDIWGIEKPENIFLKNITLNEYDGYIGWDGAVNAPDATRLEKYSQKISVFNVSKIFVGLTQDRSENANAPWLAVITYDKRGNFIAQNFISVVTGALSVQSVYEIDENIGYVVITYRSYGKYTPVLFVEYDCSKVQPTNDSINTVKMKPCYDHLFVNYTGENIVIPHESLYHVRVSRALGFDFIEANIAKTSDDVFLVNHLSSGKFGGYFHHVDGTTDISDISVDSVTWNWVVSNVRYNSTIEKYRTRPCRLEEFLGECKQQGLTPFATAKDADAIEILDGYMGKDNYIAYGASRTDCPDATIYHWVTKATKAEIVEYCESIGRPFIYGMSNPNAFTDSDLKDIIDTLHSLGYQIGVSYRDSNWYKLEHLGIDYNGTQYRINRIENGNVCNLRSLFGFNDYVFSNAIENNGVLTFNQAGTIKPGVDNIIVDVGGFDLEIVFNGTITIPKIGEHSSASYNSDGTEPVFLAVPVINDSLIPIISVASGTVIYDMQFKASIC